ncbi:MAG: sodium-dependent transporter [Rikenellaceae bacterium]
MKERGEFKSSFGSIAAIAGSAIGLGNIWRFPYVAGENGGAAFIIIYLIIVILVGIPLVMTEFGLGRNTNKNVFGAFKTLEPKKKWYYIGYLGIISSLIIISFYSVIAGWTLSFLELSITNSFVDSTTSQLEANFNDFVNSGTLPILYTGLFIIATSIIVALGVEKGIERFNKILMPVLVLILIILSINSFTLSGINDAIEFLFKADFSKVTPNIILEALGQAFFSMSIGMGCLITYGSYLRKKDNLFKTATLVAISDIGIAILAGIAIFPAVFTYGIEPASGPNLVFITLPNIFSQMSGGYFFSVLFFLLLTVAALTSSVSLMEVFVLYLNEEFKISRVKSVLMCAVIIFVIGSACALSQIDGSQIRIFDNNLFDALDTFSSSYMLTITGFLIVIYAGWIAQRKNFEKEVTINSAIARRYFRVYYFLIRYIAPTAIILIFLTKIGLI